MRSVTRGLTFTAIMKSAPICLTVSTGTGVVSPPSTRYLSPRLATLNMPGTEIVARSASGTDPVVMTISSPVSMSVATQANGILRSEK